MDNSGDTSVEEGSIKHGPLLPVDEHKELNSPETGNDDDVEHDQRLLADTATYGNGAVEDAEFGCARTEQLVYNNSVVMYKNSIVISGSEIGNGKCDNVETIAVTEKDNDGTRTHQCLTLTVSTIEDVSPNSQDKLCISEMVDITPSVETADIKGQNCDILGDNSVDMGGSENSSPLLAPLSTVVSVCAEMKIISNSSERLVEKSVQQKNGQQGGVEDCCIQKSASLGQSTTNDDGNSLTISESAANHNHYPFDKTATFIDADYHVGKETFKQERNHKDDIEPCCYENVYLEDKDTLNGGQINPETAESASLDLSTNHENRQNFSRYEPNVSEISLDDNVFEAVKETSNQETDRENVQINPEKAESRSLDSSTANDSTKNCSRYEPNVSEVSLDDSVFEAVKESSQLESDQESLSSVYSEDEENMQSLVSDDDNIGNVTFDDNISFEENETPKQESENSVKTVSCLSNSSSVVHLDKDSDDDNNCISNSSSVVHLDKASDDNNCISNSSSVVHLDKASDDNNCISNSSSVVHLDKASDDDNNCISNSSSVVHLDKASDDNNCISNSSSVVHLDKASDDNNCISNSSSVVHLDKASDDDNLTPIATFDSEEMSESLMTVNKTAYSDKDLLDIQMGGGKTVHLEEDKPHSLIASSRTVQSAAREVDEPQPLKIVRKTVHSESLGEDELNVMTEINMTVHSDSSVEDISEVLSKNNLTAHLHSSEEDCPEVNMTVHSDSSGEDVPEINRTVHSDSSGEDAPEINRTVHSDSSGEDAPEINRTVHSDSSGEDAPEVNTAVHSDSSGEDVPEINRTVHLDSSGEDAPEVNTAVHSDSSGEDVPEINRTVHSDSSGEDVPEVNTAVHSDSSGEDVPTLITRVHSYSSGEDVLKSSVTSSQPVQSTTLDVDISESLRAVRKTVHSDSSEEDDPEMLRKFRKTVPLGRIQRDLHETGELVEQTAQSDSVEENQSDTRLLFCLTEAGIELCKSLKKRSKKAMSKKKKRTKGKKGHRKKSKKKQESDLVAENLRFVEVRRDKYSEDGLRVEELEAEARNVSYNRLSNERMLVEPYEELMHQEASIHQMGGLKELGEIEYINERKKKGKKKKKKRKRRVATVEEGDGEDNASHQFPTYLDGFFLQYNEGNDDLNNASLSMDIQPRMLEMGDETHQRHFSQSEDFVISDICSDSVNIRHEESRRRRRDRREHKERKRKQKERGHSHEALHEREHHDVTVSASREYTFDWERGERYQEIVRSSERKIRRVDREHVQETVVPGREHVRERVILNRDRRRIELEEERRHSARSSPQDYRTVIAERSPVHSSQHQQRSESSGAVNETERETGLGRAKHKDQHNTGRKSHRRDRHNENFQIASSQHRPERGSDKENSRSHKRRWPVRTQGSGYSNYRGRMRSARRVRKRGASMSSSISSDGAFRRRYYDSDDGHCIIISPGNSDDDSDVILVESERIIINLDDDEDPPPPRGSITRGRKRPAIANKASEPSLTNKDKELAVANKAKEIAMANKAKELALANTAKELTMANKAKEPTMANKATEPSIANKTTEPSLTNKAKELAMANKAKELAMANKAKELTMGNKTKELAMQYKAKELAMANKAKELAMANKAKELTITNKATEPRVANKATEPSVTNKAAEPSVTNKAAEPSVTNKAAEPSVTNKAAEPSVTNKATEPSVTSKAVELAVAKKGTEPAIAKKANSKSGRPPSPSEPPISLSHTIQSSNSSKRHEKFRDMSKRERCAAPRLDHHTIEVETLPSITVSAAYDPMYPTEDAEEYNFRHPTFNPNTPPASPVVGQRPAFPDCPAPKEGRPSTPPLPVVMKAGITSSLLHRSQPSVEEASSSLTSISENATQSTQQAVLPQHLGSELEQAPNLSSRPRTSQSPNKQLPNGNLTPGRSVARQSLVPTQDAVPIFPLQNSQLLGPFNSAPFLPPPPPPPFGVCLEPAHPTVPVINQASLYTGPQPVFDRHHIVSHGDKPNISQPSETCSNQHTNLSSPQPVFDKHHIVSHGDKPNISQPSQTCSSQHTKLSSLQPVLTDRSPLVGSLAADLSSSCSHSSQGHDGGDVGTRNSVDMDFSSGDDDYHLLLLSPKANSKKDLKRRKQKQHSSLNQDASSGNSGNPGSSTEVSVKPGKTLSKDINKLVQKETPDKSKVHRGKKKKRENNAREEDEDVLGSAADLTCKEKFLKKLYFQERVIEEVKMAIKPFYSSKKITKEQYKVILRKAVPKVCHNKKGNINPQKIQHLVEAYVRKMNKGQTGGASKKQERRAGEKHNPIGKNISASVKHLTFGLLR